MKARLIGIEGRVDGEFPVNERKPYLRMVHDLRPAKDLMIAADPLPCAEVTWKYVEYRYEQTADDGTLIYRRVTPIWG